MTYNDWVSVAVVKHPVICNYAKLMDFWPALRNLKKQGYLFKSYKGTSTQMLMAKALSVHNNATLKGIGMVEVTNVRFTSAPDAYACDDLAKKSFEMKTRSLVQLHLSEEVNQTLRPD